VEHYLRLERLRNALTVSWKELCKQIDVSYQTVYAFKTGTRSPSPKLLRKIIEAERAAGLTPSPSVTFEAKPVAESPPEWHHRGSEEKEKFSGIRKKIASIEQDLEDIKTELSALENEP
jgi:transcriptional regulator with XRE-family HTH domain